MHVTRTFLSSFETALGHLYSVRACSMLDICKVAILFACVVEMCRNDWRERLSTALYIGCHENGMNFNFASCSSYLLHRCDQT